MFTRIYRYVKIHTRVHPASAFVHTKVQETTHYNSSVSEAAGEFATTLCCVHTNNVARE